MMTLCDTSVNRSNVNTYLPFYNYQPMYNQCGVPLMNRLSPSLKSKIDKFIFCIKLIGSIHTHIAAYLFIRFYTTQIRKIAYMFVVVRYLWIMVGYTSLGCLLRVTNSKVQQKLPYTNLFSQCKQ